MAGRVRQSNIPRGPGRTMVLQGTASRTSAFVQTIAEWDYPDGTTPGIYDFKAEFLPTETRQDGSLVLTATTHAKLVRPWQ